MLMPIEYLPDWEKRLARQDAFWQCEIIDRPVVCYAFPKTNPEFHDPAPKKYSTWRDQWLDVDHRAESILAQIMNAEYGGDALPSVLPNLGPEVFSAFFGCELEFSETTSWAVPCLEDWSRVDELRFSEENFYWKQLVKLTDALLDLGKNKFYTGLTDFHPGGDAIAAFRDPLNLNYDLIESPQAIKALLGYIDETYFRVFDFFFEKLRAAGQATTSWPGIVSTRKWYVPSNDFSCMVSKKMFDEIFLPGIIKECQHMEANIYHLDGPGALQHLDSLLEIKELNAIQWVYGAGHGSALDWIPVYQKCQAAGKGLQITLDPGQLEGIMEHLRPEGLWICLSGVESHEQGETVLKRLSRWR